MRFFAVSLFVFSAGMGFGNVIATVTTTTSGVEQSAHSSGEISSGIVFDGGSAAGSYDGSNLFHLDATAQKDLGPGRVVATASYMFDLLVIGTDQPGFLLLRPADSASLVLIGPTRFQTYVGNVQGTTFGGGNSNHPPSVIYVPFQPGVPVSIYASLSAIAGASDATFPGDMSAILDVFVSPLVRSEMSEDAAIPGASWIVVPEPGTFTSVLAGLGLMFGLLRRRLA